MTKNTFRNEWEMGDLDPKCEQKQGNWENLRDHLFMNKEIGQK